MDSAFSDAYKAIEWLLSQQESEARRVAVQQLAKLPGVEASTLLVRALGDTDWRVRKEAAQAAPGCESRAILIDALVVALDEKVNIGLRNGAVEALCAIGVDAAEPVIHALSKLDADGRKLAVEILGGLADLRAVRALANALSDDDPNVRATAAEALGNAALSGEEGRAHAVTALLNALSSNETLLRIAVLDALTRLEAELPWRTFEPYASDPMLRRYAIAAAATSREPEAVMALAKATGDSSATIARESILSLSDSILQDFDDSQVIEVARTGVRESSRSRARAREMAREGDDARARSAALVILGLLGNVDDVGLLVEGLGDDDTVERATLALRLFGGEAVAPLLAAGQGADAPVRAAILSLMPRLGAAGDEPRRAFRDALQAQSGDVVSAAVKSLSRSGDASDLARIVPIVSDDDPRVSTAAVHALSSLALRHIDTAREMQRRIDVTGHDATAGCVLAGAIAQAGELSRDEFAFLQGALAHGDGRARRAAVDALAMVGGAAAAEAVAFALADEEREVQLAAVRALGRLGSVELLSGVVKARRDPALIGVALRAMGEADAEQAFRAARPLVSHADPAIACAAVEAIGELPTSKRTDALFEALEHPDHEVVKVALSEISLSPDARSLARLGLCLDHASWEVRRLAAELLGHSATAGAKELLRARFEREKDPTVREAIATAVSLRPPSMHPSHREEGP